MALTILPSGWTIVRKTRLAGMANAVEAPMSDNITAAIILIFIAEDKWCVVTALHLSFLKDAFQSIGSAFR